MDWDFSNILKMVGGGLDIAGNIGKTLNKSSDQNALAGYYKSQLDNQYAADQANYERGLEASAIANANSRAAAAAANATQANQMAAAKKANKHLNKGYKKTKDIFDPYMQSANRLLPQMEGAYTTGNKSLTDLLQIAMSQPRVESKPAWMTGVPIPRNLRGSGG